MAPTTATHGTPSVSFTVNIPPGKVGLQILSRWNYCVVAKVLNPSLLGLVREGDILHAVDGVPLKQYGKLDEWSATIRQNASKERQLKFSRAATPGQSNLLTNVPNTQTKFTTASPASKPPSNSKALQKVTNTQLTKKPMATNKKKAKAIGKKTTVHENLVYLPRVELDDLPAPGYVCSKHAYYSTRNNETLAFVAEKLGCQSWKDIAMLSDNVHRYGTLKGSTRFQKGTLLRIPTKSSKWQIQKLINQEEISEQLPAECICCHKKENENDPNDPPMLLCDGCDAGCHLPCSGLAAIPENEWFCPNCLDILRARREKYNGSGSLRAEPPSLPELKVPPAVAKLRDEAQVRLQVRLEQRRAAALEAMQESHAIQRQEIQNRIAELESQHLTLKVKLTSKKQQVQARLREAMEEQGIVGFGGRPAWSHRHLSSSSEWIKLVTLGGSEQTLRAKEEIVSTYEYVRGGRRSKESYTVRWKEAVQRRNRAQGDSRVQRTFNEEKRIEKQVNECSDSLAAAKREAANQSEVEKNNRQHLLLQYASLLSEPKLDFESQTAFRQRERPPKMLGFVKLVHDHDVQSIHMLQEPHALVMMIPIDPNMEDDEDIVVHGEYAVYARALLFDAQRDDMLPMDANGVRGAQRRLMSMLLADPRNSAAIVSMPELPTSVKLRGNENDAEIAAKCFDLSELVRDCNCDLDLPKAPTPARLAANGLELRDYQMASLKWMIDKENESSGLGLAGELWARIQFFDGGYYYYCELTGTFSENIFNFKDDAQQKDAAMNFGGLPTGGILGEEMGLGKTVISIALIVANPPPKENQVLAREYKWESAVNHPDYTLPPSVQGATATAARPFLSNGTLVIAPMTLCSQWQREIERFAPFLSVKTMHSGEDMYSIKEVASTDVVIISTFVLQSQGRNPLLNKIRRIHWHRILVDESHYNQQGQKSKLSLAALSATHRHCVTGTPIGHSLDDLQGQLRFLRIPQFTREAFWTNNIANPYCERNLDALQVLRKLLSSFVIRHSKEQTSASGADLLALPPRTVETELLLFGSEAERKVYEALETRNRQYFQELRLESPKTVLSKFIELTGAMYAIRQACSHVSMINLHKVDGLNRSLARRKEKPKKRVEEKKTRASILVQAVEKARPSAELRMREIVLRFQEREIELLECPVCLEPFDETRAALTPCAHPFCSECILNCLDSASLTREPHGHCPQCREVVKRSELTFLGDAEDAGKLAQQPPDNPDKASFEVSNVHGFQMTATEVHVAAEHSTTRRAAFRSLTESEWRSQRAYLPTLAPEMLADYEIASSTLGTKVSRLLEEIRNMVIEDETNKAVVFSQFLGVLDVAAEEMTARGIRFVRVDGSMKMHERADALFEFSNFAGVKVFLLSMRAGAVGLNLTAANHCFILDTPQNSAVEEQAIDRIHRIGQTRPVIVKRFVMAGTIEERILAARRSLVSDRPAVSTQIDGAGMLMAEEKVLDRPAKRARLEDEQEMAESSFQRLKTLETLFGYSSVQEVAKA